MKRLYTNIRSWEFISAHGEIKAPKAFNLSLPLVGSREVEKGRGIESQFNFS